MLKIGDFSKLARISIRMLRHYDEIGLLHPAEIDRATGYRYYREDQLPAACRIAALRDMGFGLAATRALVEGWDSPEVLEGAFQTQRNQLAALSDRTAYQMRLLDIALERLRKGEHMNYNVTKKTIPERYAACLRMTIPRYEEEGRLWAILTAETEPLHTIPDDPCLCSVTFHDREWKEHDVDLEAQMTLRGRYPDTEHVTFRTLPPVTVASATYQGPYDRIGEVYAAVYGWITANGYQAAGPMMNFYHVSPHETQDPEEFVTEVCCPIR